MIFPNQEEMLNSPAFQERLAVTLAEGILDFFKVPPQAQTEREQSAARRALAEKKPEPPANKAPAARAQARPKESSRGGNPKASRRR